MRSKAKRRQKSKEREVLKAFQEGQWRLFLQQGQCSQVENIWAGRQMTPHPSGAAAHWHFEQMPFPPWRTFSELMVCGRTAHPGNVELKSKNCTPPPATPCQVIIVCPGCLSSLSSQTQLLSSQDSSGAETVAPGDCLTRVLKG